MNVPPHLALADARFLSSAFGLSLVSNRALPGLPRESHSTELVTHVALGVLPAPVGRDELWYCGPPDDGQFAGLRVWRSSDGGHFTMDYGDGTTFVLNRAGTHVWASWASSSTLEDTTIYLLGPVLGFVLRLRATTCLHASAVEVNGQAVALLGPAGAGKSTTAAAFAMLGYPLLTEDIVALRYDGRFSVLPGYPQIRLWPESVAILCGDREALPRLTPTWDKRALDCSDGRLRFQCCARPLAAIYLLPDRCATCAIDGGERAIVPLRGAKSVMTLVANTYVSYLLDTAQRRDEFTALAQLAAEVPMREVTSPVPQSVFDLCEAILHDFVTH